MVDIFVAWGALKEIDLHGLKVVEAIDHFVEFYNQQVKRGSREPIRVIHGYGASGVGGGIADAIGGHLETHSEALGDPEQSGSSLSGILDTNPGVTIVYPLKPLPTKLGAEIVRYCERERTSSEIVKKCNRRYPKDRILAELDKLRAVKLVEATGRGGGRRFKAIS